MCALRALRVPPSPDNQQGCACATSRAGLAAACMSPCRLRAHGVPCTYHGLACAESCVRYPIFTACRAVTLRGPLRPWFGAVWTESHVLTQAVHGAVLLTVYY